MLDAIEQFRTAMHGAGLNPPPVITPDGKLHRFSSNGKPSDDAGWYVLHGDGIPAGAFGDWRAGLSQPWRADLGRRLSTQEERAHKARMEAIRRAREADDANRHATARIEAQTIWEASQPAPADHAYLVRKGVYSFGLRLHGGALVVPIEDAKGLQSLQFIHPDGTKRFLPGGRVAGGYFLLGQPSKVLCVAEGYATAASIHEATGHAVAVAFSSGNLTAAARALRLRFLEIRLLLCADMDLITIGKAGMEMAREAAQAVGGFLAVPDFGDKKPEGVTDFNDLHQHRGLDMVRACIERVKPLATVIDSEEWPEMKPIKADLKHVPAFDAEKLLPEVLRNWVNDEAERMACPPDFIAVAALVALGSIIGARCAIKPKARDSWLIVPNLWGGIVGDPSAKKSPAWGAALRPMDALIATAQEKYQSEMADYQTQKVVFDAERAGIEDRIKKAAKAPGKGGAAVIAQELRAHEEGGPVAPKLRRFKTNDTTVEKLGELLRENPTGILVLRDELVGLISSWDREGREGDRAFFLEAWNGGQHFDTDRIGRGHISIPNLCVSIFGGIQPDKLTGYLEQAAHSLANDGMLQRFQLLVYPDRRPWAWCDRAPNKAARDAAQMVFERIADLDPMAWGASPADDNAKFPFFRFDEEAQEIFIEWSGMLHRERMPKEEEPIIQQHLAKFDKLFPALALIFRLVECASQGIIGPITKESAQRAADWCEYLEAHARRCYGLLLDNGLRAAQALARKLERGALKDGFTLRDVRRNAWRNLSSEDAIQAALDWLESDGWLRGEASGGTGPGGGRRTIRYRLHPKLEKKAGKDGAPNEDA